MHSAIAVLLIVLVNLLVAVFLILLEIILLEPLEGMELDLLKTITFKYPVYKDKDESSNDY
jgi:hypothetical protein